MNALRTPVAALVTLFLVACGGGDGGTPPITVARVGITAPTSSPTFRTLGRTLQFSAAAFTSADAVVAGTPITWSSSAPTVASVSGTGLVTALSNGTAEIRASAPAGVQSPAVVVTVSQVATVVRVTPGSVLFGALGSTRQLSAVTADSSDAALPTAPLVTWSRVGPGSFANVSPAGLVTALAVGVGDTAVATVGTLSAKVPIVVTQLVRSILVASTGIDTLATTGRNKTYVATPRDSNTNTIPGLTITWSSTDAAVASVGASTGVATAVGDGTTGIRASVGTVFGERSLIVRRFASTFSLAPTTIALTTVGGSQAVIGTARDSTDAVLPISWLSRSTSIASVTAATGATTTVTAVGNGNTFLLMLAGRRTDSASVSVSGQPTSPLTAGVQVGDNFFRSTRNASQNMAVDTVAVGGTVTWTFSGFNLHNIQSVLNPSFTSSALQTSGTYAVTFPAPGAYDYICQVHGQMTGRIVVR